MAKDDPDVWFEPKRFGYGAGLPVAWQGWALLIGYVAVVAAAATLLPRHRLVQIVVVVAATAALMAIAAQHTRGGWHWRSGGDE